MNIIIIIIIIIVISDAETGHKNNFDGTELIIFLDPDHALKNFKNAII